MTKAATTAEHYVLTSNDFSEFISIATCIGAMLDSFNIDELASCFNRKSIMVVCTFLTASCSAVSPVLFCALISERSRQAKSKNNVHSKIT